MSLSVQPYGRNTAHCVREHSQHCKTVEPGYNDIDLNGTSSITSDIMWKQLIPVNNNIVLPS